MKIILKYYLSMSESESEEAYELIQPLVRSLETSSLSELRQLYPDGPWTQQRRMRSIKDLKRIQEMFLALDYKKLL